MHEQEVFNLLSNTDIFHSHINSNE